MLGVRLIEMFCVYKSCGLFLGDCLFQASFRTVTPHKGGEVFRGHHWRKIIVALSEKKIVYFSVKYKIDLALQNRPFHFYQTARFRNLEMVLTSFFGPNSCGL